MAIALPRRNTEQLCFIFSPITLVFSLLFRSVGYGKPSLSCKLINYLFTLHYITLHYITFKVFFFSLGTVITYVRITGNCVSFRRSSSVHPAFLAATHTAGRENTETHWGPRYWNASLSCCYRPRHIRNK